MADIINLRQHRKKQKRETALDKGAINRALHGQTLNEREKTAFSKNKTETTLNNAQMDKRPPNAETDAPGED